MSGMETVTVKLTGGIRHQVDAMPCRTPGLVVHRSVNLCDNGTILTDEVLWTITHKRSGLLIGKVEGPEAAMWFADMVIPEHLPEMDWEASGDELRAMQQVHRERTGQLPLDTLRDLGAIYGKIQPGDTGDVS